MDAKLGQAVLYVMDNLSVSRAVAIEFILWMTTHNVNELALKIKSEQDAVRIYLENKMK